MSDRSTTLAAVTVATLIVGGSIYAVLRHAAPMIETAPPPAPVAPTAPTANEPSVTASPPSAGAIYRCNEGGSVVYSDASCKGGRVVEVQHTQGWEAPRPSVRPQSVAIAEARTVSPDVASTSEKSREAECGLIESQIAQIDAAARVGGTIPYMEDLKERRRKLVDRKFELRC
jgi:hypothetical protein